MAQAHFNFFRGNRVEAFRSQKASLLAAFQSGSSSAGRTINIEGKYADINSTHVHCVFDFSGSLEIQCFHSAEEAKETYQTLLQRHRDQGLLVISGPLSELTDDLPARTHRLVYAALPYKAEIPDEERIDQLVAAGYDENKLVNL